MDTSIEIRVRSSSDKGNYKIQTSNQLKHMINQILVHEEIIKEQSELNSLIE